MNDESLIPNAPSFSDEDMRRCRDTGDYAPVFFEWYKFVGSLGFVVAHIQSDSPAFRSITLQHYHVLVGLLNRCARLMLSNVALSHEGQFGETTAIIDRCIFETAAKILWLCEAPSQERFLRYLADGLKTELEFKSLIESNIASRGGEPIPIETRMLASIGNHIAAAQLTEEQIADSRKLPNVATMLSDTGHSRLYYVIGQRLGSHHVHGTWSSLLTHYLEEDQEFTFVPRGHDCETHINQYVFVSLFVLRSLTAYLRYALAQAEDMAVFEALIESTEEEIRRIFRLATGDETP